MTNIFEQSSIVDLILFQLSWIYSACEDSKTVR